MSTETATVDPVTEEHEIKWRRIRRRAAVLWGVLLTLVVIFVGVPTDRGSMLLVVLTLLGIPCLGRGWGSFRRVLLDWLPFTAVLMAYDYSRGVARMLGMPLHMADIASVDRGVFGTIPTVWLQERFLDAGHPHWYDAVATLVYTSHFLATPIVAAVLWLRSRTLWLAFVTRVIALALAGLVTYIFFPAAPPWYAAREAAIGPAIRASSRGWIWLHIDHAGNLLQQGQLASNQIAAMPSLHTGYATMIAMFTIRTAHNRFRYLMIAYPLLMGISLVYLGEHYVIDVVAGVIYAIALEVAIRAFERRRARREVTEDPLPA
jgi:membrane-associated phospholipid phosphatase